MWLRRRLRSRRRLPCCGTGPRRGARDYGQGRPPGGEGILPSLAPIGALPQAALRTNAPCGACEGKMPSPPAGRPRSPLVPAGAALLRRRRPQSTQPIGILRFFLISQKACPTKRHLPQCDAKPPGAIVRRGLTPRFGPRVSVRSGGCGQPPIATRCVVEERRRNDASQGGLRRHAGDHRTWCSQPPPRRSA